MMHEFVYAAVAPLLVLLAGCIPRDNPYDSGNPDFVMPVFSCTIHLKDAETMEGVKGAIVTFVHNGTPDSTVADSSGNARVSVGYTTAAVKVAACITRIASSTHAGDTSIPLTLSREGRDTIILLRDRRAKAVGWDTVLTYADSGGVHLAWHASDAGEFLYYRVVRINPVAERADTIGRVVAATDTVLVDRNVDENELYLYRIDVVSHDGTARQGVNHAVAVPNRKPFPPEVLELRGDFFIYLRIRWTMNNNDDFAGYTIYRGTDSVSFVPVYTMAKREDTVWLDTTITGAARVYYYYVEAVDAGGLTSASGIAAGVNTTTVESGVMYLHGGTFTMGRSGGAEVPLNQQPAHPVFLSSYLIDRYEVTVDRYVRFLNAGNGVYYNDSMSNRGITKNGDSFLSDTAYAHYPVTWISWSDADTFCKWSGGRLPTEAQWERAARGDDGRLYPWGETFYFRQSPPDYFRANYVTGYVGVDDSGYSNDGARYTAPVGNYASGVSPFGVYDMSGNVSEWCSDWYWNTYPQDGADPVGPQLGLWRSYRGGGFKSYPEEVMATYRFRTDPSFRRDDIGCRCVYDPR